MHCHCYIWSIRSLQPDPSSCHSPHTDYWRHPSSSLRELLSHSISSCCIWRTSVRTMQSQTMITLTFPCSLELMPIGLLYKKPWLEDQVPLLLNPKLDIYFQDHRTITPPLWHVVYFTLVLYHCMTHPMLPLVKMCGTDLVQNNHLLFCRSIFMTE